MTDEFVIENKISTAEKYLKILEDFEKYSRTELEENLLIRGAVERYLYLVVQATIDLAEAAIAYRKLRKPSTLSEAFYVLGEAKIIDKELMDKMVRMCGFRNVIAHDYAVINYDVVDDVLRNGLEDIKIFLSKIGKISRSRRSRQ